MSEVIRYLGTGLVALALWAGLLAVVFGGPIVWWRWWRSGK